MRWVITSALGQVIKCQFNKTGSSVIRDHGSWVSGRDLGFSDHRSNDRAELLKAAY